MTHHTPRSGSIRESILSLTLTHLPHGIAWAACVAAITAGISLGLAQPLSFSRVAAADAVSDGERLRSNRIAETKLAIRRERAHVSLALHGAAISGEARCPAFPSVASPFRARKVIPRPFLPRHASPRERWRGVAPPEESAAGLFNEHISGPVVQERCVNCHAEGGVSGHTRLVLATAEESDHEVSNLAAFRDFVATVDGGADLILNKIQGVGHGGGVQVLAGSADFANMERFVRLIAGGTMGGGVSPETLFDGVTMAPPAKTLRRAALVFAGRLPTAAEVKSVSDARVSSLRRAIRDLMEGPQFHEFLLRAANDRLLTDRHLQHPHAVNLNSQDFFVDMANAYKDAVEASLARGYGRNIWKDPAFTKFVGSLAYGLARAPLELIAHVAENDLPYTEILTADYIMANAIAAKGYGATTRFENPENPREFKPSKIVNYYRDHDSKIAVHETGLGTRIINPGNLATDYPHAGILNTNAFLRRYPSTATNRNRARARWTYYHFLAVDIEKSASRTTDPEALADTDNPTMKNPSCTVCHRIMDPVAGAFQNYGDEGLYRDQWGGMDSLARLYKYPEDGSDSPYREGDTWYRDMREAGFDGARAPNAKNSLQWLAERIVADGRFADAAVRFWWPALMGAEVAEPPEDEGDADFDARLLASNAQQAEVARLAAAFRQGIAGGAPFNIKHLLAEITLSPWFRAESVADAGPVRSLALATAGGERILTPEELARKTEAITGYGWGRKIDGVHGTVGWLGHDGFTYRLLYGGIDSDGVTERVRDMNALMAAVAQRHAIQVSCPIVQREFFFWPEERRRLFRGIDLHHTPLSEAYASAVIEAESWADRETNTLSVFMLAGTKTVRLRYPNNYWDPDARVTRNLVVDELVLRDGAGSVVRRVELETLDPVDLDDDTVAIQGGCDGGPHWDKTRKRHDGYELNYCEGWLDVPVEIPSDGSYRIEVVAWQLAAGDEPAALEVAVESNSATSQGALAIRRKLAELHKKLHGLSVLPDSPEVDTSYQFFLNVWNRKQQAEGEYFHDGAQCGIHDHLYFSGIADVLEFNERGDSMFSWDKVNEQVWSDDRFDFTDLDRTARTWVVVLAYLLTDYRYLHL